jgi:hypothetical protein
VEEDLDVFFDDLSLQHSSGPIVRTEDYYVQLAQGVSRKTRSRRLQVKAVQKMVAGLPQTFFRKGL